MNQINHKKRFLDAINMNKCESLSHGDQMIHDKLVAEITHVSIDGDDGNALAKWMTEEMTDANFERHLRARKFLGMDWCQVFPMETIQDESVTEAGHITFKDIWGTVQVVSAESNEIIEKPIESVEGLKTYRFPDPSSFGYENIKRWVKDGTFAVCAQLDNGFFKVNQLTGFEEYMYYVVTNNKEMHELMERFLEFEIAMADHLIDLGVDVIWLGNDFCYNKGPFMSPEMLQEFDFDYMKRLVSHVNGRGLPVVLHCCGNIKATIRQMIDTGINAIHSLQPSAGNDIYAYKEEYGHDVCLIGNVDINELMPNGSPCDIDGQVKTMTEKLFYDRKGWVLSTTNLLSVDTPVENAITMHLAAEKYS